MALWQHEMTTCTWSHEVRLHIGRTNEPKMTTFIHTKISAKYKTNIIAYYLMIDDWVTLMKQVEWYIVFVNYLIYIYIYIYIYIHIQIQIDR